VAEHLVVDLRPEEATRKFLPIRQPLNQVPILPLGRETTTATKSRTNVARVKMALDAGQLIVKDKLPLLTEHVM
jgi:hypothetical protein